MASAPRKPVSPYKRLRFRLEAVTLRAAAWLVSKCSRRFAQRLGRRLGSLAYALLPTLRRISLENLQVAFRGTMSREQKQRIARASLANVGATLLALFWSPRLAREQLDGFVDVTGLEHVRVLKAQGRPIIFITLHYGDWELLGLATGFYGIPITVVQEAMQNEALEEIFGRLRAVSGHRIVPGRFAATTLLKTLKRGGNIALLIDLNATPKRGGVWLDFFGLPVFGNAAVAALALHTGAAIVPGVAHPLPDGRCRIVYGPEIAYQATGDYDTDVRAINQQCLRFCEDVIRQQPEHWMWSYKRWKFLPEERRDGYPFYSRYWPM